MKRIEELINKICEINNYDDLMLEIIKEGNDNNIYNVLEVISNNSKLSKEEKKSCYSKIFDYVKTVNENYENKVKEIYMRGFKEATIILLSNCNEDLKNTENICFEEFLNKYLRRENE